MESGTIRCNVCGAEVDSDTVNCPYCGCSVKGDGSSNVVYDAEGTVEADYEDEEVTSSFSYVNSFKRSSSDDYEYDYDAPEDPNAKTNYAYRNGAKAFKWLMIVGIIRRLESLSDFLTGNVYKGSGYTAEDYYLVYGNSLKYLDIFFEIAMALLIVTTIIGIVALSKYKSTASFWVIGTYAGTMIASVALLTGRSFIFKANNFNTSSIVGLAFSLVVLIALISYFRKTKHIFVN